MRSRFDEQLADLNKKLIEMGAMCEECISLAAKALKEGNVNIRWEVEPLDNLSLYSETINSSHNLFISKDAHPLLPARRCVLPLPEISLKLSFSRLIRNIALYIWLKADMTSFFKVASVSACSSSNCLFCSSATMLSMCLKPNNNR